MSLEISNVDLSFADGDRTSQVLKRVSLAADPGTITAITGPSGSGKSTLLSVASTLLVPDAGTVVIDGTDVTHFSAAQRAAFRREHIGIVFQQSNLLPSLTAREQLLVMNELGGTRRPKAEVDKQVTELLTAVGLAGHEHKRPGQLSGGQRQRVNIARAFMANPSVFIVDEPTSALDQRSGSAIIDLLLRMTHDRNTATLLVTHDLRHLDTMDAHYEMLDGILSRADVPFLRQAA